MVLTPILGPLAYYVFGLNLRKFANVEEIGVVYIFYKLIQE